MRAFFVTLALGALAATPIKAQPAADLNAMPCLSGPVMLLKNRPGQQLYYDPGGRPNMDPTIDPLLGRNGSVVSAAGRTTRPFADYRVLVRPEGSDRVLQVSSPHQALGTTAEYDKAQQWVGRTFWTKGSHNFLAGDTEAELNEWMTSWRGVVRVGPAKALTVKAAKWGRAGLPIVLTLATADGKTLYWPIDSSRQLDPACHYEALGDAPRKAWTIEDDGFLAADPRITYARWGPAVWRAIDRGGVEAGMTAEMLDVVCGKGLEELMRRLGSEPPETIWSCLSGGPRFVMRGGKVIGPFE